ncbi:myelin basic protein-like [Sebastes umbrosus]|uniref:myelin basic protein-like n=1 Tax=Sebastes umbrosus TaxID=72105 RepID=UPI00189C7C89|nr:myelin basic protein-like [Sebastes umbrosus]
MLLTTTAERRLTVGSIQYKAQAQLWMNLTQSSSEKVSVSSMGQHLVKREAPTDSKAPSPEPEAEQTTAAAAVAAAVEPESHDEVFGLGEADANQNNGCVSEKPVVTDSTGAEGPRQPWPDASTADPDAAMPRPHLARLFSRDAPGREDNTFKERPSESDELQTIQEHSGAGSECGSESPEQDLE